MLSSYEARSSGPIALAWNFAVDRLVNEPDIDPVALERACHDEAWGCAYARVWRAHLDVIREAARSSGGDHCFRPVTPADLATLTQRVQCRTVRWFLRKKILDRHLSVPTANTPPDPLTGTDPRPTAAVPRSCRLS